MPAVRSVSIIIPHYGDPAQVLDVIELLRRQDFAGSLQIVVVDDASPLAMPQVPAVEVVRRPVNGGFGSAVNSGMGVVSGECAIILNSDVRFGPTFVSELVGAASAWMPAVVSPKVVGVDGASQWAGRRFPTVLHRTIEWLTPLARFRDRRWWHVLVGHDVGADQAGVAPVDWVMGACMLLPVSSLRHVGGFDESYYMNSEEVDLQRRLSGLGVISVVANDVVIVHEGGGSTPSSSRRRWLVDARHHYAAKWGHPQRLKVALTAATAANLAVNLGRQAARRPIDARRVAAEELRLIWGRRG